MKRKWSLNKDQKEEIISKFTNYITSEGLRHTPERDRILEKVLGINGHFNIQSVLSELKKEIHISKSTVYNTMQLLCKCGIVVKIGVNDGEGWYELNCFPHLHLICTKCGTLRDIEDGNLEEYIGLKKFRGFRIQYHTLEIFGLCSNCRKANK